MSPISYRRDAHHHAFLGGSLKEMQHLFGTSLPSFHSEGRGISALNDWITTFFRPLCADPQFLEKTFYATLSAANADNVTHLETSINVDMYHQLGFTPEKFVSTLKKIHQCHFPKIHLNVEAGFSRRKSASEQYEHFMKLLPLGFFTGVDLYDQEDAQPAENFRLIYREAKKNGLTLKAHTGEFGQAEDIRRTAQILELDEIQHGITATKSSSVMRFLADAKIPLNLAPASNIALGVVPSWNEYPLRVLYDHGVQFSINTDDFLLFQVSISEQIRILKETSKENDHILQCLSLA